jgi:uncharacterized protein YciI
VSAGRVGTPAAAPSHDEAGSTISSRRCETSRKMASWTLSRSKLEADVAERLQPQHLGHLEAMRLAGHLRDAGPLIDQRDPRLCGICHYRTGSIERARELASAHSAVRAGQLEIETMGWLARPDALGVEPR